MKNNTLTQKSLIPIAFQGIEAKRSGLRAFDLPVTIQNRAMQKYFQPSGKYIKPFHLLLALYGLIIVAGMLNHVLH